MASHPGIRNEKDLEKLPLYEHKPLANGSEYRLVELRTGRGDDPITCSIMNVQTSPAMFERFYSENPRSLDSLSPPYRTLSVDPSIDAGSLKNICILDKTEPKRWQVSWDVHSALQQLRQPDFDCLLWVESLCIDAKDTVGRNHLTAMAPVIYSEASKTVVWLGDTNNSTKLAFQKIASLARPGPSSLHAGDGAVEALLAVYQLLLHRYFSAPNSLQHLGLARDVELRSGSSLLTWKEFRDGVRTFVRVEEEFNKAFRRSGNVWRGFDDYPANLSWLPAVRIVELVEDLVKTDPRNGKLHPLRLEELVTRLACVTRLSCEKDETDPPKESVYNVLSLAADVVPRTASVHSATAGTSQSIQNVSKTERQLDAMHLGQVIDNSTSAKHREEFIVDYGGGALSRYETFMEHALRSAQEYGDHYPLDLICRPWAPTGESLSGLGPTRVPSWIRSSDHIPFEVSYNQAGDEKYIRRKEADALIGAVGQKSSTYNACGNHKGIENAAFQRLAASVYLKVTGTVFDTVVDMSDINDGAAIEKAWLKFGGWKCGKDIKTVSEELLRTLVADKAPSGHCRHIDGISRPAFGQITQGKRNRLDFNLIRRRLREWPSPYPNDALMLLDRIEAVIWRRRLVRTSQHKKLGIAPSEAQKGDAVCIIFGCSVPLLLRQHVSGGVRKYTLVGECYIDKMMDGEAVRNFDKSKEQDFCLV